ncbi:TPA: hypothetical protein JG810_004484 [Vibrio parahaemolyticus]|nr:hypothetical protein [Vibrio parahaemolyticus]
MKVFEFNSPQEMLLQAGKFDSKSVSVKLSPIVAKTLLRELYNDIEIKNQDFIEFKNSLARNVFYLNTSSDDVANTVYAYLFGIVDIDEKTVDHEWLIDKVLDKETLHQVSSEIDALVQFSKTCI